MHLPYSKSAAVDQTHNQRILGAAKNGIQNSSTALDLWEALKVL